jgi:hypothetical protein
MSEYYFELTKSFSFLNKVKEYLDLDLDINWHRNYYDIDVTPIPVNILKDDIIFKTLSLKFEIIPLVVRFDAKKWYTWHTDKIRNVGLNSVIQGKESHVIFGKLSTNGQYFDIEEIIYEDNKTYLLDVSKSHSIVNLGEPRIIISLGFPQPIMFNEVKEFCIENNL